MNGGKDAVAEKHSVTNWKFEFDGNLNSKFDVYDSAEYATNSDCDSTSIYYLPVYFLATDALGNCSAETGFFIKHNPEADKPKLEFTYPTTENYKSSTEQYAVLGGTIRATGSAVIPSGTTTVNSVYYQIATKVVTDNGSGTKTETWNDFGTADKEKAAGAIASGGYAYTIVSAYDVINELTGKNYSASTTFTDEQLKDFLKNYGFVSMDVLNAWWGIKATGTASWNFKINEKGELNPDSGTTDIRLRVCGVNAEGKFGAWTNDENVIEIHVDNKAPVITYAVNQYANGSAAITALPTDDAATTEIDESKPTASKTYEAEMYLKGNWTFVATLLDETSVTSYNVKVNGSPLTENEGYFVKSGVTAEVELKDGSKTTKKGVTLFIPIPKPAANSETDTVEITVSADDTENHTEQTFDFKIDETAPSFDKLSGNGTLIADNKLDAIEDSNYHFMLDGEAEDNGSGVKNVVFYFMRKNGTTGTIGTDVVMDPMITTGTDDSKVNMKDAQGKDALTALEYTQGNDKFYLYANSYSGSATTDTFTSGSDYDAHVRKGGLVQIDGVLRTITGKSGTTVTFTPSLTEAKENVTAYFPIAQVIDNPATEKVSSYSTNPFTFERGDDGDNMPESFSGKATKTWSAEIRSANMPDGPVSIVILAFDEAGNVAGKTINTKITNNAPRLAKVFFGTDLSGDKKFTNSSSLTEIVEYDILGAEGATQSSYTLDFNEKLENESAKYPAGVFTIKNGLAVIPELTGGNGDVGMVLNTSATSAAAVTGTVTNAASSSSESADSDGKVTGTFSGNVEGIFAGSNSSYRMHSYVIDARKLGADGDKGMSFTFWDSTEETTQGSTSQKAVLYVTNFKVAQGDSVPPTVVVNPFYWNSSSDNSLYANSAKNGHIELEEDLPTDTFKDTNKASEDAEAPSGEYDRDPKVSGKIRFTGTAYDNRRLDSITVQFGTFLSTATSVATYNATTGKWTVEAKTMADDGYKFTVTDATSDSVGNFGDSVYFDQKGHKVYWTLDIDTERISTKAATDVQLTVLATDAAIGDEPSGRTTSTATTGTYKIDAPVVDATTKARTVTDGTTNYPIYQMDVVPYISDIETALSKSLKSSIKAAYSRTALGHYIAYSTETIAVKGFNLGSSSVAPKYGDTDLSINSSGNVELPVNLITTSGQIALTVNSIQTLNNLNNNNAYGSSTSPITENSSYDAKSNYAYNRMPNKTSNNLLTDDVVIDVWQFDSDAAKPMSGELREPSMQINPVTGQVGLAFVSGPGNFAMAGNNGTSYSDWQQNYATYNNVSFTYDALGNAHATATGLDTNPNNKHAGRFSYFYNKWGRSGSDQSGNYNGKNALRLESIAVPLIQPTVTSEDKETYNSYLENLNNNELPLEIRKTYPVLSNGEILSGVDGSLTETRFYSPSLVSTIHESKTAVYLAYYDSVQKQIRFRYNTEVPASKGDKDDFVDNSGYFYNYTGVIEKKGENASSDGTIENYMEPSTEKFSLIAGIDTQQGETKIKEEYTGDILVNKTDSEGNILYTMSYYRRAQIKDDGTLEQNNNNKSYSFKTIKITQKHIDAMKTDDLKARFQLNQQVTCIRNDDKYIWIIQPDGLIHYTTETSADTYASNGYMTHKISEYKADEKCLDNRKLDPDNNYTVYERVSETSGDYYSDTKQPPFFWPYAENKNDSNLIKISIPIHEIKYYNSYDTGYTAYKYVAIDARTPDTTKGETNDVVVAVWYDGKNCRYAYNTNPTSGLDNGTAGGWNGNKVIFSEGGEYCTVKFDPKGGVHIAAYVDGSLRYAYLSSYDSTYNESTDSVNVDSFTITGERINLDVGLEQVGDTETYVAVPYITYFNGTARKPTIAKLLIPESGEINYKAKGTEGDIFTGNWEISLVPSPSTLTTNYYDKMNIGLWKWEGKVVNSNDSHFGTVVTAKTSADNTSSGTNGNIYGNGTANPILGYAVESTSGTYLETAQMK